LLKRQVRNSRAQEKSALKQEVQQDTPATLNDLRQHRAGAACSKKHPAVLIFAVPRRWQFEARILTSAGSVT
jgi:hypothetical protein